MDDVFTFDMEVMASAAYRNAFTSLLRSNIGKRQVASGSADGNRDSIITITTLGDLPREKRISDIGATSGQPATGYDIGASRKPALPSTPKPHVFTSNSPNLGRFDFGLHTTTLQSPQTPDMPQPFHKRNLQPRAKPRQFVDGYFVQALYDYDGDDRTSLSFCANDIIQVIAQLESGWWDGVINGVQGWFPSTYCRRVSNPQVLQNSSSDEEEFDDLDLEFSDTGEKTQLGKVIEKPKISLEYEAAFWIPQATPDGRLYYYNTLTRVSTMDLLLQESPSRGL